MTATHTKSRLLGWSVLASMLVGAAVAWLAAATPRPLGLDAPPADFSAGRAMVEVRAIAAHPHPSGSAEITSVRHHILDRLRTLGLETEVQTAEGLLTAAKHKPGVVIAGAMNNVIGVLPGRDRNAPALLVMSHYDTMPNTPGAGDDTAGTAASLEIARALKADGHRQRDVIFLYTDGEEPGELGAQAFFANHSLARQVGLVINLEARGDTGRAAMFEASPQAGALIRLIGAKASGPNANSLMADLYHRMPNDTDLSIALDHGVNGLNFAFAGTQLAYHTSLSTPDDLDPGSLQHMGGQVLPLARQIADATALPARTPDLVYSDILGRMLVAYPPWVGWVSCAVTAALIATAIGLVRRRGLANWADLGRGAAGLLLATLGAMLCLHLAGRLMGGENSVRVYDLLARYPLLLMGSVAIALGASVGMVGALARGGGRLPVVITAVLAGAACSLGGFDLVGALIAGLVIGLALLALGRPTSIWGLWGGALAMGLALALLMQATLPSGGFLLQWPLLLAALAAVALLVGRIEMCSTVGAAILGIVGAVGFAQISGWSSGFFVQMGPVLPDLLALFVPPALLVLAPGMHALAAVGPGRRIALSLFVVGAALLTLAGARGWPGETPRRLSQVFYFAEPGAGRFHRASATRDLDAWSRAALGLEGSRPVAKKVPLIASGPIWMAPAPAAKIQGPALSADSRAVEGEADIVLRVRPANAGRELKLLIQPTSALRNLTLNGRPFDALRESAAYGLDRLMVVYSAPPPEGIAIGFRAPAHGRFEVTALEVRDGWPAGAPPLPPRPKGLLTWGLSDATVAQSVLSYGW